MYYFQQDRQVNSGGGPDSTRGPGQAYTAGSIGGRRRRWRWGESSRKRGGSDDASVAVNLYGENTAVLVSLSAEVERRLKGWGIGAAGQAQQRAARYYGVDPQTISGTISYSLRGHELPKFQTDEGRQISVLLQLEDVDRQSIHQLRNLTRGRGCRSSHWHLCM